jgi:hypothetical protein
MNIIQAVTLHDIQKDFKGKNLVINYYWRPTK